MKIMRPLVKSLVFLLAGLAPAAAGTATAGTGLMPFEAGLPLATPPSLYSFADVVRLTVAGEPFGSFRFADVRTPGSQAQVRRVSESRPPDFSFAVSTPRPRESQRWALVLAGLFACAWVAHRRLASPY